MNGTHLRFINSLILIIFCVLGITGLYGLVWPFPSFLFEIHRMCGWALILLIPWKTVISLRSLRRGLDLRFDRSILVIVSLLLAIATITILILVLLWTWQIGPYFVWIAGYGYSGIGWHWGIALGLAPLFIIHVWRRWPHPRRSDFIGRRQALKLLGLGAASIASWEIADTIAKSMEATGTARRFTGSREEGSFTGVSYPVTSGPDQGKIRLDPATWTLTVKGLITNPITLKYDDVLALSTSALTATIDCTGGWYSTQIWRGVHLEALLERAAIQTQSYRVILRDVSGYTAYFMSDQASEILLATHVGDQVLDHWHGYPLRAVIPSRRGGHWVKWLTEIEIAPI